MGCLWGKYKINTAFWWGYLKLKEHMTELEVDKSTYLTKIWH
jgi:hypothetical protein